MRINVEFVIMIEDKEQKTAAGKAVGRIKGQINKYALKEKFIGEKIYSIDQDNPLYQQVIDTYLEYKDKIEFTIFGFNVELSKEEEQNAVAFAGINPNDYCEEYYDISYEYNRCNSCGKEERSKDVFYAQPNGYLKRKKNDYGVAWLDGCHEVVLLPKLVERLKEAGVSETHFFPVLSKRKAVLGYVLTGENILPKGSYEDPNYKLEEICSECNAMLFKEDEDVRLKHFKTLTQDGLARMEDINYTFEYYDGFREIVVSPRVYRIIKEHVKDVSFMPVFLK